eukprot:CAMPEP_0116960564 /NCGR_PEP_ID=MMETSP0467-20121206/46019_1 /TAXON_ID=283647 /ORGANISM="Mesodinium pulex, Strain SPMC105" /LENGTH=53 /DNA_ID=CAMNT_0004648283 /DNA_START=254 /DNA_END=412 /DNA_ORIENTATION=-
MTIAAQRRVAPPRFKLGLSSPGGQAASNGAPLPSPGASALQTDSPAPPPAATD